MIAGLLWGDFPPDPPGVPGERFPTEAGEPGLPLRAPLAFLVILPWLGLVGERGAGWTGVLWPSGRRPWPVEAPGRFGVLCAALPRSAPLALLVVSL